MKARLTAGLFSCPETSGLSCDAQLRDLGADLRERGGDLARLRQHEEVVRAAGAGRQTVPPQLLNDPPACFVKTVGID
jgi:hypothetical protein